MTRAGVLALALLGLAACSGRVVTEGGVGAAGAAWGGAGGSGAASGSGGVPCVTQEGVRLCGGTRHQCDWVGPGDCPGGGCARPYDRKLGGPAAGGLCFSDLRDNGSRSCLGCNDGEVCIERKQGEFVCVPESVCAGLWKLGVRGVCRYADLSAYDGRPLTRLSSCPDTSGFLGLCDGPCPWTCNSDNPDSCTGRSPDHPQGFCFSARDSCALDASGYTRPCPGLTPPSYCGVFHAPPADAPVARLYGQCTGKDECLVLSKKLPGGYDCFDPDGKLVKP